MMCLTVSIIAFSQTLVDDACYIILFFIRLFLFVVSGGGWVGWVWV